MSTPLCIVPIPPAPSPTPPSVVDLGAPAALVIAARKPQTRSRRFQGQEPPPNITESACAAAWLAKSVRKSLDAELSKLTDLRKKLEEVKTLQMEIRASQRLAGSLKEPYCMVPEVAAWLGTSAETVQRMLIFTAQPEPNKIRARRVGALVSIRCWTVDVYELLPKPEA